MSLASTFTPARTTLLQSALVAALACGASVGHAIDFGPDGMFTLTGFAKVESSRASNQCNACARFPSEDKQRIWADEVVPGREYKTGNTTVTLFQPWLGANYNLGSGYKFSALLSQRWRDGMLDMAFSINTRTA